MLFILQEHCEFVTIFLHRHCFFRQIVKIIQAPTVRSIKIQSSVILKEFTTRGRERTVLYIADSVKVLSVYSLMYC